MKDESTQTLMTCTLIDLFGNNYLSVERIFLLLLLAITGLMATVEYLMRSEANPLVQC